MNIEQRLQHASRDLREVRIVVPPLGGGAVAEAPRRSMATPLLVPLLFLAGALFAVGTARTGDHRTLQGDLSAATRPLDPATAPTPVEVGDEPELPTVAAPSALVELQLITEFVSSARTTKSSRPAPTGVDARRLASGVGPI